MTSRGDGTPTPPAGSAGQARVSGSAGTGLVFVTSALVLVLEIVAGRLMAPYIGVSLDTFTGIIGTILAGIALGSAYGGKLADRRDPLPMIGWALIAGGALSWLSIPIVVTIGPSLGNDPVSIVILSASSFVLPTAVLSAISPMVAKMRLHSIESTGEVVGSLSAAGTAGALIGTFLTGFVLLGQFGVRTIIAVVGGALVIAGFAVLYKAGKRIDAVGVVAVIATGLLGLSASSPCDHETEYYCVLIVDDEDRPTGRSLILDQARHAHVDLADPTFLDIRYIRLLADVVDALPPGPIDVLHLGGGGFTMPRYISETRPGSTNTVLELDEQLVEIVEDEFGLDRNEIDDLRLGDARPHLDDLETDAFDLIIGDAFGGSSVPWHLTTTEVMSELDRLLRTDGVYAMNVIDGDGSRYAKAQLATLARSFDQLAHIEPADGIPNFPVNQVLVAADVELPTLDIDPADGALNDGSATTAWIGDAPTLTDNFAPVDQLLLR